MTASDDLVPRAIGGDHAAFAQIVAENDADMRRLCFVMSGDSDAVDEAVQSAWHRAWLKLPSLRDHGRLRPWLLAIAANEQRQLLRRRGRRIRAESAADTSDRGVLLDDGIARVDLGRALRTLSPSERELLALRYVFDFGIAELARQLQLSPEGVRSRLKRSRDRLRKELTRA